MARPNLNRTEFVRSAASSRCSSCPIRCYSQYDCDVLAEYDLPTKVSNTCSPTGTTPKLFYAEGTKKDFREEGDSTAMIVISDGDIIKNRFNFKESTGYPLGYDFYTETLYANKELLLNCIDYLAGAGGSISSRSRDITIRKLNVMKVKEERTRYQLLNVLLPVLLIAVAGVVIVILRRKKYQTKK